MTPDEWEKARLIGEHEDDERIDSADDEELDSDDAFDESDDERFAGFFSKKTQPQPKKQKASVRFADVDLDEGEDMASPDEDEDEEEDGDPDEFIDLLDVLDGKGDIDTGSDDGKSGKPKSRRDSDDEEDEESTSEEEEEEAQALSASEDEDVPEAAENFQNFISTLDPTAKKRKASETETADETSKEPRSRKRRIITEKTEAGAENEFRAHASSSKLQLNDLLAPLTNQSANLLTLKKNIKILSSASTKVKALSAPLPQRTQERLDREAAYEQTKEEVDKWSGTMKRIREAEHLSFPLQARPTGRVSNLELAAKFKPSTKLESAVDSLLRSAKLRDEDLPETEDTMLKLNNLTVEEVAARRGELRRMRELMFRAELKAKRINKIKSKAYRKIKRKEKERLQEKLGEGNESETEEGLLKRETERARERATLRHKNTGKWAKQMKNKHLDEGGRHEIEEMLQRGEQLKRKIQGLGSDESEEESSDEEEEIETEEGVLKIKKSAFDEIRKLEDVEPVPLPEGNKGSIFEMKFMKDAMAREQLATDQLRDDFIKEIGGDVGQNSNDEDDVEGDNGRDSVSGVLANRTGGRMQYRPGAPQIDALRQGSRSMGSLASDTSSVTLKSTDLLSPPPPSPQQSRKTPHGLHSLPDDNHDENNPWLSRDDEESSKVARKKNEVFGKDSKKVDKSKNKLKKLARKLEEEKTKAQDDAVVEISMDDNLTIKSSAPKSTPSSAQPSSSKSTSTSTSTSVPPKPTVNGKGRPVAAAAAAAEDDDDDDSDADSELEAQEESMLKAKADANPKGLKAFQQRDLVALAFAGDNVVHEFEEAKKREIAADAPKDVDTTIPGWGSWGGTGIKKSAPKPQRIKRLAGIDPTTRADYNKKHVIISEKRDKKASKYIVKDLPYPYTSRAQYERSMEQPLGKEWNTRVGFQRATLPRVVKKPGIIIDPLEKHS